MTFDQWVESVPNVPKTAREIWDSATAAERERCANIALNLVETIDMGNDQRGKDHTYGWNDGVKAVANRIREGAPNTVDAKEASG